MLRQLAVVALVLLSGGCGDGGDEEPGFGLASPSAACEEAFAAAAEAGERPAPASPRSPDLSALRDTLEACGSADEWLTSARGHRAALPFELDRSEALDRLCAVEPDTSVCRDWTSTSRGADDDAG